MPECASSDALRQVEWLGVIHLVGDLAPRGPYIVAPRPQHPSKHGYCQWEMCKQLGP